MNFMDTLNQNVGAIERPPLIPIGTYIFTIKKVPAVDTIAQGRYDVLDFMLKLEQAREDVDQADLAKFGGLNNTYVRHRFMFNKEDEAAFARTLFNVKRFVEDHLKVPGAASMALKEALNACVNTQGLVTIGWRPDGTDPEVMYAEPKRTAPLE